MLINFPGWLYRTYLNLSAPHKKAPLHTYGVEFDYLNLANNLNLPRIQSVLMPSFRSELVLEARDIRYAVNCPLDLPEACRTDRWEFFCKKIQELKSLEKEEQARVLWLMNKLCFYGKTKQLKMDVDPSSSSYDAELSYIYTLANYALNLEKKSEYSLSEFESIAVNAPKNSLAKINASYQMVVQNVKHGYNLSEVEKWLPKHYENIIDAENTLDEFNFTRLLSRYYRVGGFLPQMKNDYDKMVRIMELAEKYANRLFDLAKEKTEYQELYTIAAREMLYPVIESRTKEAMLLGDYALAEQRAKYLVTNNPNESRARLHLGQVLVESGKIEEALSEYLTATELGPPGQEIAWFMIGQCYEALSNLKLAASSYKRSLYYDCNGVSAFESLVGQDEETFEQKSGFSLVEDWSKESLIEIKQRLNQKNNNRNVLPYQKKQFNETVKE